MNGLGRFFTRGAQEADQRVASILAPPSLEAADRYLLSSLVVRRLDRAILRVRAWWFASHTWRGVSAAGNAWRQAELPARDRMTGLILVAAAGFHVTLTLMQGPRPGWFWTVIPAGAAAVGLLLLVSRSAQSPH